MIPLRFFLLEISDGGRRSVIRAIPRKHELAILFRGAHVEGIQSGAICLLFSSGQIKEVHCRKPRNVVIFKGETFTNGLGGAVLFSAKGKVEVKTIGAMQYVIQSVVTKKKLDFKLSIVR